LFKAFIILQTTAQGDGQRIIESPRSEASLSAWIVLQWETALLTKTLRRVTVIALL